MAAVLPLQEHWLPLSNLDLLLPPVNVSVFFCYKKPNSCDNNKSKTPFGSMTSVLKKSMAQTLVSYYAFAGEIVANLVGEPEVVCNNPQYFIKYFQHRGVDFVEAYADVELEELNLYNPDDSIEGKLVPEKIHGVLAVQATELKCGGIVVACTFDHRVADAYSTNMFLVSWAETTQSKQITLLPSFRRSLLNPGRPLCVDKSIDDMYVPISTIATPKEPNDNGDHLISRIYYVKAYQLNQLQSLASVDGCKRTKLEAFCALLWKMVAQSDTKGNAKVSKMGIVVDGRTRIAEGDKDKETLMASYFGNVLSIPYGCQKLDDLTNKPLNWVANEVHNFLHNTVTKEHFMGLIDWVEAHRPQPAVAKIYCNGSEDGPAFVVSSGQRFPVSKINFGWDKPFFGSYHFPWGGNAGYVMPMPSPGANGDWVVYMHLYQVHLEVIETQAKHVFKPLTCDYLK
ncbi:Transferase domain-containing protein, partial [Cephalotus follicularis]